MSRAAKWLNLAVFLVSVLTIAVVVNVFAQRSEWRERIDATKTRAYSLSEQTQRLVRTLEGEWTIAMVMVEAEMDRGVRRQIDEVLSRFTQASNQIAVKRIDPTNPRSLVEHEALLSRLRAIYAELAGEYEQHLDTGVALFEELLLFAQQQTGMLEQGLQIAQATSPQNAAALQQPLQRAHALALLAEQGDQILQEVNRARRVSDVQPIPDYETARSILAHALDTWANELYEMYEEFGHWRELAELPLEFRQYTTSIRSAFERRATQLAAAAEPLLHLPPLELSRIGREIARGEAAVIIGPDRAAVIPSDQLIVRSAIGRAGDGGVRLDQRFRGEQLIASAMRSLTVEHMPLVVFVHAEERTLLRPRDRQVDLVGVATVLSAARFEMMEWMVSESEQPEARPGQRAVYVVVPPMQREGIEPSRRERQLIAAVERLMADGESVLLSVYPSVLPRLGQPDPWASVAMPFGLSVDTGRVIHESVRVAAEQTTIMKGQAMTQFEPGHPIAAAIHGQQAYFNLPMAIQKREEQQATHHVIAALEPSANRWLEPQWEADAQRLTPPPADSERRLTEPAPLVVASERVNPMTREDQRFMLVSSGGWMLSYIADVAESIGGERVALVNPAHHELMLAAVAWLAEMDDLIAPSPMSQEVARLGEISPAAGIFWSVLVLGGLPIGILLLGIGVWLVRTSTSMPSTTQYAHEEEAPSATAGLVLGILSIVLSAPLIGLILGLVGFQFARQSKHLIAQNPRIFTNAGIAHAGYICSIIGIVLGSVTTLSGIVYVVLIPSIFLEVL